MRLGLLWAYGFVVALLSCCAATALITGLVTAAAVQFVGVQGDVSGVAAPIYERLAAALNPHRAYACAGRRAWWRSSCTMA